MHRFIGEFNLSANEILILNKEIVHQVKDVLRLKAGEWIGLSDGAGEDAVAEILASKKGELAVKILERRKNDSEPACGVILYCALLKKDNFEWVVQKAVEVGVNKIVPVLSERTVKADINLKRLEKIIKEAAEQSGRGVLPTVEKPVKLKDALASARSNDKNWWLDANGQVSMRSETAKTYACVGVFIGPEGGWTQAEITLAQTSRCSMVSLGKTILRAETAAVVASYLAVNF